MNVHLTQVCEGCRFHEFPYKAVPPISGYGEQVFESEEDVYAIIQLLIDECREWNQKGKTFDIATSVSKQLVFFVSFPYLLVAPANLLVCLFNSLTAATSALSPSASNFTLIFPSAII